MFVCVCVGGGGVDIRSCQPPLCPQGLITPRKEVCRSPSPHPPPTQVNRTKVLTSQICGQVSLCPGIMGDLQSDSNIDKQADPSAKTSSCTATTISETPTATTISETLTATTIIETLTGTQLQQTLSMTHKTMLELAKKLDTPAASNARASCDTPTQKGSGQRKWPRDEPVLYVGDADQDLLDQDKADCPSTRLKRREQQNVKECRE